MPSWRGAQVKHRIHVNVFKFRNALYVTVDDDGWGSP
jgi:hypothetical protein